MVTPSMKWQQTKKDIFVYLSWGCRVGGYVEDGTRNKNKLGVPNLFCPSRGIFEYIWRWKVLADTPLTGKCTQERLLVFSDPSGLNTVLLSKGVLNM